MISTQFTRAASGTAWSTRYPWHPSQLCSSSHCQRPLKLRSALWWFQLRLRSFSWSLSNSCPSTVTDDNPFSTAPSVRGNRACSLWKSIIWGRVLIRVSRVAIRLPRSSGKHNALTSSNKKTPRCWMSFWFASTSTFTLGSWRRRWSLLAHFSLLHPLRTDKTAIEAPFISPIQERDITMNSERFITTFLARCRYKCYPEWHRICRRLWTTYWVCFGWGDRSHLLVASAGVSRNNLTLHILIASYVLSCIYVTLLKYGQGVTIQTTALFL